MSDILIARRELAFQLYEMQNVESLCDRERFAEHSRETFDSVIDIAEQIARDKLVEHNRLADEQEPQFDGERVSMRDEVKVAFDTIAEAGFLAGRDDYDDGGMQLPETVMSACMSLFTAANPSTSGYPFLTMAAARLIRNFASENLRQQFFPHMLTGRFTGTMALTEPHAGSSLADIRTKAVPAEDGSYRIKGNKVYISAGDHELSDNIVHLVLAKIEGAPAGVKGISLFLVPKFLLDENGNPATRNDVALAGLFHKLGYRGTTSTALNFGEKGECVGYLIGEPHYGLKYMFQMMNEARLGVGMGAAAIGYRGYQHSLEYARERPQGRLVTNPSPESEPVPIIEHADVKRMLLAQKAYTEGALALCFYGARLIDDSDTGEGKVKEEAHLLLDLLTPILKAWPSEYGPKANDLAIQVFGGAGYTREYPVEQCWRDNRLNPIHEGTNGIQSLDLLGRKLWQHNGQGLQLLHKEISSTMAGAHSDFAEWVKKLGDVMGSIVKVTMGIGGKIQKAPEQSLANSHAYLNLLGHTVIAWQWLKQANIARAMMDGDISEEETAFYQGKIQAAQYFFVWELPLVDRDIQVLMSFDQTCLDMENSWF
ncbi:acyl-CoA dehydrogenase [Parendozoicomonas haliclonae]|uniref:Acyl-CoA dehydrogenase n=1 Tax=Parendozoicomonas haliclonae TaxID=1960125 RepID=A0A1X7AHF4_9GAMM|nr:acyl-CoA dehydrogenase [Parendozoicomonas haliclonae]SMA42691.1 Acyl-CoA dehydrogenase [Parendozoicomonas haliclonae]